MDGEESMDLEEASFEKTDNMDATSMYGEGIVQRRRSSVSSFRPAARSSLAPGASVKSSRDTSHPIGEPLRPPRPPSRAFVDLQNAIAANFQSATSEDSAEMSLDEATNRLSAVARNDFTDETMNSFSSSSSFANDEDKTLDFTTYAASANSQSRLSSVPMSIATLSSNAEAEVSISDSVFREIDHSQLMDASLSLHGEVLHEDMTIDSQENVLRTSEASSLAHPFIQSPGANSRKSTTNVSEDVDTPPKFVFDNYIYQQEVRGTRETSEQTSAKLDTEATPRSPARVPTKGEASYLQPTRSTSARAGISVFKKSNSDSTALFNANKNATGFVQNNIRNRTSLPSFATSPNRRSIGYFKSRQSFVIVPNAAIPYVSEVVASDEPSSVRMPETVGDAAEVIPSEFLTPEEEERHPPSPSRARRVLNDSIPETYTGEETDSAQVIQAFGSS